MGDPTQQLNEGGGDGTTHNWLAKNNVQMTAAINTAIAEPQLKALQEYKAAHDLAADHPDFAKPENVAKRKA